MPKLGEAARAAKAQPIRVLLPLYRINNYGGIINWVEHLCHGLRANGALPHLVLLEDAVSRTAYAPDLSDLVLGPSGLYHNQSSGWAFSAKRRLPIHGVDWPRYVKDFELVIWVIPVPSEEYLWSSWRDLYDITTPQVMVVHDGNLPQLYPHAQDVMPKCVGVVGVHDCAIGGIRSRGLPGIRGTLIPNPQIARYAPVNYGQRVNRVLSLQTFKSWKHVDDLIRAVPHLTTLQAVVAGGGIEQCYMTSRDKRKDRYGNIWERAKLAGMKYVGYISEEKRDALLRRCKLLVDTSWSRRYAAYGSHFNRVFVDAVMMGALPAARDLLMRRNSFFDPRDYITIPYKASPEGFAAALEEAAALSPREYTRRVKSLQAVVREHFDSVKVAKRYLDFIR